MALGWAPPVVLVATVLPVACVEDPEPGPEPPSGEVVVEHVTRIGEADHPAMMGGFVWLTRLRDGRYALFDMYMGGVVRLFGPEGAYRSTLGREGYGPGEFSQPRYQFLDATGDTLFVLDIALSRISAFSPDGSELYDTRITMATRPLHVAWLDNGWFVANLVRAGPDGVPRPLHLVNAADRVVQSFGTEFPLDVRVLASARKIDVDDRGTLWAAPTFEYRVERWRRSGAPDRPSPWTPCSSRERWSSRHSRSTGHIRGDRKTALRTRWCGASGVSPADRSG